MKYDEKVIKWKESKSAKVNIHVYLERTGEILTGKRGILIEKPGKLIECESYEI